jgi:multiple sugar transport system substrate-binding protein
MPGPDGAPGSSFVGGGDLAVFNEAENPDGAWKYVQWLTEPETQQGFYEEVSALPAVQSAWESGELADDEQLQVFGQQLESAESPPAVPTWEQVASSIDTITEQVSKGDLPADEAVKQMQSEASSIGTGL